MNDNALGITLLLSLIHAFLGKIDSRIRGIQVIADGVTIKVKCCFDDEITEVDQKEIDEIESEIISALCSPYNEVTVCFESIRLDSPTSLP
ncbi:hypothetical protein [Chamaesiphon minutus]|uniref:Uncharacterized protein n=1 Tax=Chamaesiphon minutus (strain ATCC 27169 / PCC 6605) TaxID=1173020 RepID=K9ULS3_CHAP6|nr:hypothetical protein [Chamaesiphon minutus]AFY96062.1 hypothetical protein Cha6605_5167 [Chamaesiphon minutus PCC 6605]